MVSGGVGKRGLNSASADGSLTPFGQTSLKTVLQSVYWLYYDVKLKWQNPMYQVAGDSISTGSSYHDNRCW